MAIYTVTASKHATLSANTVDTVTINIPPGTPSIGLGWAVEILNRSDADIYATTNGTTPTVGADNTKIIPAKTALTTPFNGSPVAVKLVSTSAAAYSVTAVV